MNLQSITSSLRYLQGEQGSLLPVPVAYVQNTNGTVSPVYVPRPQRGGAGGLGGAHRYSTGDISLMGLHTVEEGGEGAQARHSNSLGRRSEKGQEYAKPKNFNKEENSNSGRGSARVKPGKELYRPPVNNWNLDATEFQPVSPAPLTSSRSVDFGRDERQVKSGQHDNINLGARTGLTITVRGDRGASSRNVGRSESFSLADSDTVDVARLGTFPPDVEATMKQAMEDPNRLSGRSLMELVRQIFTRVVESQKMAETAARFCISIIEREKKETFLESLLNNCQEWYHERDHLLRSDSKSGRWSAFMSFLNEMYGLLKRKQLQLMTKYEGIPPKLVLLSLLAECCTVTLTSPTLNSVNEVECLFLVLTHIGRDLIVEAPGQMTLILSCLREAFLMAEAPQQVRKTLLQLIELQAAGWQLPAESVMYYYPGAKV